MKTVLSPTLSALFVVVYAIGTLALRFYLEPQLQGAYWISLLMGGLGLLFIWALVRIRFLDLSAITGKRTSTESKA